MACCRCCQSAIKDALKGISLLTALGGLACLLLGIHALLPLGPAAAADIDVAWFAYVLLAAGAIQLLLGTAAATGSWCGLTAPLHCLSGATLVLLPLESLLAWAFVAHPRELRWLADRDQTYALAALLAWVEVHRSVAAGLAGLWLLLQAAAVALGAAYACCPTGKRHKHPWGRYWSGDEEGREALLPRSSQGDPEGGTPRAAGYHTPPSRFQSPYASPARTLRGAAPPVAPATAPPPLPGGAP